MATAQMANGKSEKNGKAKGKFDFAPVEFDRDSMPPACPAGEWSAKLTGIKVKATKVKADGTGGYPMLEITWKLTATEDEENESFVGSSHRDYLVIFPKGHKAERMGKLKMRAFCENFDVELDTLPTGKITKISQFNDFVAAAKGTEGTLWTFIQTNDNGEDQTAISYRAPGGGAGAGGSLKTKGKKAVEEEDEDEEEEEDETEDSDEDEEEEESDEDEDEDEDESPPVVRGKKGAAVAAPVKRGPGRPRKQA